MSGQSTTDIVSKLWNLCNVLKDDGVTYHQYVSELTYLLFLKMAKETGTETGIPEEWRWDELEQLKGLKQLEHYKLLLLELGSSESGASTQVQEIYVNANSFITKPVTLKKLVTEILGVTALNKIVVGGDSLKKIVVGVTPRTKSRWK